MSNLSDYPPGCTQSAHDAAHRDYPAGTPFRAAELAAEDWENQGEVAREWLLENAATDWVVDVVVSAIRKEAMPTHEDCHFAHVDALARLQSWYVSECADRYMDAAAEQLDEEATC